jgi:hypothetical protein
MENRYRHDLPSLSDRLKSLPIQNGYPVPWFVAEVDGKYDFRIADRNKFSVAVNKKRCWICGQKMGAYSAFPIGPMCSINRVISEPPSHKECAEFAVKVCPFLVQRQEQRRSEDLPEMLLPSAGNPIMRQPGVVAIWVTKSYQAVACDHSYLFDLGDPTEVSWWREGRPATRAEVLESINSGYPLLEEMATKDGVQALRALEKARIEAIKLIPPV